MSAVILLDAAWDGVAPGVEALLDSWAVGVGVPVVKGQTLATVVLVKASIDIEAPANGHLSAIYVKAEESFVAGKVLAEFQANS
jgi:biotin carboxyl carrier protein